MDTFAQISQGFIKGVKDFFEWVPNPFEECCPGLLLWVHDTDNNGKGGVEEDSVDLRQKGNASTTRVTTTTESRIVVQGGGKKEAKDKTGRLTAEVLRSLNTPGRLACGGRRTAASHSSGRTLDTSSDHSSSSNSNSRNKAVGIRTGRNTRDGASERPSHGVGLSSGVDVTPEWDRHLARVDRDVGEDGRGHATSNGDGLWGGQEDEDDVTMPGLFDTYDGSLESLKRFSFPSTSTDRPVKTLFDATVLSSTSPAKWMTTTEFDIILGRLGGRKNGCDARDSRRRS